MLLSFSLSLSLSTELQEFWKQDYFYTLSWKLISKPKRFICLKICLLPLKKPQPNTLSRDSSPFRSLCPSRSLALSLLEIATLLLFFFFFPRRFSFYFRNFPRAARERRRDRVVPSGLSGDVDRCREQKTAILKPGGELFARLFVDGFRPASSSSSLTSLPSYRVYRASLAWHVCAKVIP